MKGHIIAVLGAKGGSGKSVIAANLAIAYLQEFRQRPLIMDCDFLSLGDQNLILGQNPAKTLVDLSQVEHLTVDPKGLSVALVNAPLGYSFLGAPRDQIASHGLNMEGMGKILKGLTQVFSWTVVDCGSPHDPLTQKILEFSSLILVVTAMDFISIHQAKKVLSLISDQLYAPESVQIIVNRTNNSPLLTPSMIQKTLGKPIFGSIPEDLVSFESALAKASPLCVSAPNSAAAKAIHDIVRKIEQSHLLDQLSLVKRPAPKTTQGSPAAASSPDVPLDADAWTGMKLRVHKELVDKMDLKKTNVDTSDSKVRSALRERTQKAVIDILETQDTAQLLPTREIKAQMIKEILDEALGLGPLEDLLSDDTVTEIMVNARNQIYIERLGKPMLSKVNFSSDAQMMTIIERIVTPLGRRVDEKVPYVDARLLDGSRVHVIIPPLSLRGPTITIRKFPKKRIEVSDLITFGSMTEEIADFLRLCVEAKLNIVVSGGTGSGKTTLLNVLSNFIPVTERIITVEDSAEIQLGQDHVVRLETRPKNIEGEGEVSIRDLIKCCLRMRPDRIVVGECRSGEALDMLQAMNTGHSGSLTTIHSNNPRECIARLETLVMMAGLNLGAKAIKENIASAVGIIIQQSRLSDGSRKITHITEVVGIQGDVVSLQDIFLFKQEGLDKKRKILGRYVPTGFIPKFVEEMEAKGMKISRNLFAAKAVEK